MKRAVVLVAAIGLAVSAYLLTSRHPATAKAAPAPALALVDLSGNTINTSTYRGEVVIVNFWAAWCTPCRDEIPQFVALQEKYRGRGLQAIGISMEDPEGPLHDFYQAYKMNYPVVMGNQDVAEKYGGILGLPTTFLIGRDGLIHGKLVGATDFPKLEQQIVALLAEK
jgi:thiol-disulfide isomerase/thioredoxin